MNFTLLNHMAIYLTLYIYSNENATQYLHSNALTCTRIHVSENAINHVWKYIYSEIIQS